MRWFGWIVGLMAAICVVAWVIDLWHHAQNIGPYNALHIDFTVFWAAAKLALDQGSLAPFDTELLNNARNLPEGIETFTMLWLYPPGWLMLLLPLGALPFFWAWLIFTTISITLFAVATRTPAQAIAGAWPLVMSAPVVLITLALGQNSLIFASLLVLNLEALRREQYLLAGLFIALMTLKPQLGLAIPVALIAAGYWRVIFVAALGSAVIVAASLFWPGLDYWPLFFQQLKDGGEYIRQSDMVEIMTSGYGTLVMAGLDRDTAVIAQALISILAAGAVVALWRSKAAFDLKAAGLAFSTLLITPYAIHYEMVFSIIGVLYLAKAGALVGLSGSIYAILTWALPIPSLLLQHVPVFAFATPLLAVGLSIALYGRSKMAKT